MTHVDGKVSCSYAKVVAQASYPNYLRLRSVDIGLYTPAILRFEVVFPAGYPERPPSIAFLTEIFHPLVKPLTTYTYTTHDTGADTVSASDDERLPPGGFSMRHGFPSWFVHQGISSEQNISSTSVQPPHIVEVLFYVRNAFKSAQLLDTIPLGAAANPGAWHAWQSFRSQSQRSSISGPTSTSRNGYSPSLSRQQPGGARKPGEWNWEGVWEDRIRRGIRASTAEQALFRTPGTSDDLVSSEDS